MSEYPPSKIIPMLDDGIPDVAWPTVILIIVTVTIQVITAVLYHHNLLLNWQVAVINIMACFASFTPMHDAAHGSVAKGKYRYLNNVVGYLSSFTFPVPFLAFKHIHLLHHKNTNRPDDPDIWAGSGPTMLLPLRWMTIEIKYYVTYLPKLHTRPTNEAVSALTQLGVIIFMFYYFTQLGYWDTMLYSWIIPGRVSSWLLALFFDYIPHRPHKVDRYEDMYEATAVTSLFYNYTSPLTWLLLHQNYHNIHHLAPYVPFYMYSILWHQMKKELIKKGTKIKPLIPLP